MIGHQHVAVQPYAETLAQLNKQSDKMFVARSPSENGPFFNPPVHHVVPTPFNI
jgi:hypothetical protein